MHGGDCCDLSPLRFIPIGLPFVERQNSRGPLGIVDQPGEQDMRTTIWSVLATAGLSVAGYSVVIDAAPRLQTGPNAEVTHDGLTRVDKSVMDMAWVQADLDLRGYKKLMLAGAEIQYRVVDDKGAHYRPGRNDTTEFPISDESKAKLRETVSEVFREQLAKSKRYEITNIPGPDTLLLVGTLIDVVSKVPPDDAPGRYDVYLSSVGEATLVLELRDSMSNEVLARAADRRAAEQTGYVTASNPVTTLSEVRRLASSWANLLRKRLDEVTSVGEM
jgi:Protein of unknown function (DUF3313)